MTFSQRNGNTPIKPIQLNSMDESLRNRLYNLIQDLFEPIDIRHNWLIEFVLDKCGVSLYDGKDNYDKFTELFMECEWYEVYDIFEFVIEYLNLRAQYPNSPKNFCEKIQKILCEEKSGYRLINNQFVPITNDMELNSLVDSSNTELDSVNEHMKKAIALYSDRKKPDYENSIKESISAVEVMCCTTTGLSGRNATLGFALKKLKNNRVVIHGALEEAFLKLYGYTSDEGGIRHGAINFAKAPAEDAKYMLISCSAFVNYLIEKWS